MADKQIDFPPLQKEDKRVAPVMIGISLLFIVIMVIILLSDLDGPFIGPWGCRRAGRGRIFRDAALSPLRDLQPKAGARPPLERELGHDAPSRGLERRSSCRARRARMHLPRLLRQAPGLGA